MSMNTVCITTVLITTSKVITLWLLSDSKLTLRIERIPYFNKPTFSQLNRTHIKKYPDTNNTHQTTHIRYVDRLLYLPSITTAASK